MPLFYTYLVTIWMTLLFFSFCCTIVHLLSFVRFFVPAWSSKFNVENIELAYQNILVLYLYSFEAGIFFFHKLAKYYPWGQWFCTFSENGDKTLRHLKIPCEINSPIGWNFKSSESKFSRRIAIHLIKSFEYWIWKMHPFSYFSYC